MCFAPQRRALFRHLNFQYILTSKCASRRSGMHFFDISTSKSAPNLRRVLYILTSKCASRHNGVQFFDISTSKSGPDLVCFCTSCILTSKCASRHNGVHFSSLIWPAGSAPATFASLLFDPPEPQIIGKHSVSRLSYLFALLDLLSSETFSFFFSFLSDSSHLCFSICPYCRKFDFLNFLR